MAISVWTDDGRKRQGRKGNELKLKRPMAELNWGRIAQPDGFCWDLFNLLPVFFIELSPASPQSPKHWHSFNSFIYFGFMKKKYLVRCFKTKKKIYLVQQISIKISNRQILDWWEMAGAQSFQFHNFSILIQLNYNRIHSSKS